LITDKEAKEQLSELKKMLLPEMLPDKLKYLNAESPNGINLLVEALNSEYPGLNLIDLIQQRIPKALKAGSKLNINDNGINQATQLNGLIQNIDALTHNLKSLTKPENKDEILVDNIISISIMIGYNAGSHDMKVNVERHANNGFENNVINPHKGGIEKAKKFEPAKKLVQLMATKIILNPKLGKISKPALSTAIHTVLQEFSNEGNNKNIETLKSYTQRCPGQGAIKGWIVKFEQNKDLPSNLKKPSHSKLVELLKIDFPARTIKKFLKS